MSRSSNSNRGLPATDMAANRLIVIVLAFMLTAFGVLMIYSASSVVAMISKEQHYNPAYYAIRQCVFAAIGAALALVVSRLDYHTLMHELLRPIWFLIVLMLVSVWIPGLANKVNGAYRWIKIASFTLQPSEFAKPVILLFAANLIQGFCDGKEDLVDLSKRAAVAIGIPLLLILFEPDKGTVMAICLTILIMMYLAGISMRSALRYFLIGVAIVAVIAVAQPYSRARIAVLLDPWLDEYGKGYQLIQGLYAFASGGLFGVGIGNSRQKYSYLPEAHNDFIFAVIGEELGLVGTLAVLLVFLVLVYVSFRIAKGAPDLSGRLIAAGSITLLVIQMLINVCGVLDIIPLSGKPIPFLSYGGSSIMATLLLVGLVLSVARTSMGSRSASGYTSRRTQRSSGFRVIEGGSSTSPSDLRSSRALTERYGSRITYNANGTRRINLGPSASDRLRGRVSYHDGRG